MKDSAQTELTLRERKRRRIRATLVDAGRQLFEERGYDATTVADIAEAAEIGTRTFFSYFESKELLLFPDADQRVDAATAAIENRTEGQTPVQVLLRAFDEILADDDEMVSPLAQLRLRLMEDVPAVQARGLRLQAKAKEDITDALVDAFPEIDSVSAAALVGAFVAATTSAVQAQRTSPNPPDTSNGMEDRKEQLRAAIRYALGQG